MFAKKKASGDRLAVPGDDPEYAAASAEYDRLAAKHGAAVERATALEQRTATFGPVDAETVAERAAVARLAAEEDADPAVKALALTIEALAPLELALAEARAEVALREKPMRAAETKLDALRPVVRERQGDEHLERIIKPLRTKTVEAMKAALVAMREADGVMDGAKAHFGFRYAGHQQFCDGAAQLAKLIDLIENGPPPPVEIVDVMATNVAASLAADARRAEERRREAEEYTRRTGWRDPYAPKSAG